MLKEYYFWKWADNDLPGHPAEVHAALLRGEMHPALQTFNSRPLLRRLQKAQDEGRDFEEEWDWQLHPQETPGKAHFVFVTCPEDGGFSRRLDKLFLPLGLTCYDERNRTLVDNCSPKLNCVVWGQYREVLYDIREREIKEALKRIKPKAKHPFVILIDQRNYFVQCLAVGRRFIVEWRENYDLSHPSKFDQWRAQDPERLAAVGGVNDKPYPESQEPELVRFEYALHIFKSFLRGEPMPAKYSWVNISKKLNVL